MTKYKWVYEYPDGRFYNKEGPSKVNCLNNASFVETGVQMPGDEGTWKRVRVKQVEQVYLVDTPLSSKDTEIMDCMLGAWLDLAMPLHGHLSYQDVCDLMDKLGVDRTLLDERLLTIEKDNVQ